MGNACDKNTQNNEEANVQSARDLLNARSKILNNR